MSDTNEGPLVCREENVLEHDEENNAASIQCGDENQTYEVTWSSHVDDNYGYVALDGSDESKPWITPPSYTGTNGRFEDDGQTLPTVGQDNGRFAGHWIQIKMPTPRRVESYRFDCGTIRNPLHTSEGIPRGWTLLGSASGTSRSWVVVHTGSRTETMWNRSAKMLASDPKDGDEVFLRNVNSNTFLSVTSGTSKNHPQLSGDEESRGLMLTGSITSGTRPRMVWKWDGETFKNEDSCGGENFCKLEIGDFDGDHAAHLGTSGTSFSIEKSAGGSTIPDRAKRLKVGDKYLTRRATATRNGMIEGASNGTTDRSHWLFETDDPEKADGIYDANAPSGEIKHPSAYQYFRLVFTAATHPGSIRLDHLRLQFTDGSAAGGPAWKAGSWTPACSPSDPDSKVVTREVTCESNGTTVPDSMCSGKAPAEESTCGDERTPPGGGAESVRQFFRDYGIWLGVGFAVFVALIVMAMMFRK